MIAYSLIIILISNAITSRRDKPILYSRIVIQSLFAASFLAIDGIYLSFLEEILLSTNFQDIPSSQTGALIERCANSLLAGSPFLRCNLVKSTPYTKIRGLPTKVNYTLFTRRHMSDDGNSPGSDSSSSDWTVTQPSEERYMRIREEENSRKIEAYNAIAPHIDNITSKNTVSNMSNADPVAINNSVEVIKRIRGEIESEGTVSSSQIDEIVTETMVLADTLKSQSGMSAEARKWITDTYEHVVDISIYIGSIEDDTNNEDHSSVKQYEHDMKAHDYLLQPPTDPIPSELQELFFPGSVEHGSTEHPSEKQEAGTSDRGSSIKQPGVLDSISSNRFVGKPDKPSSSTVPSDGAPAVGEAGPSNWKDGDTTLDSLVDSRPSDEGDNSSGGGTAPSGGGENTPVGESLSPGSDVNPSVEKDGYASVTLWQQFLRLVLGPSYLDPEDSVTHFVMDKMDQEPMEIITWGED